MRLPRSDVVTQLRLQGTIDGWLRHSRRGGALGPGLRVSVSATIFIAVYTSKKHVGDSSDLNSSRCSQHYMQSKQAASLTTERGAQVEALRQRETRRSSAKTARPTFGRSQTGLIRQAVTGYGRHRNIYFLTCLQSRGATSFGNSCTFTYTGSYGGVVLKNHTIVP